MSPTSPGARAVGVYRLWRDLGFAVGSLLTGLLADAWGIRPAVIAGMAGLWRIALASIANAVAIRIAGAVER